jgi:hypothetical protein
LSQEKKQEMQILKALSLTTEDLVRLPFEPGRL